MLLKKLTGLLTLNFFSEEVPVLWEKLQQGLLSSDGLGEWLRKVSIIACEGEQSWDDYLLLSHPDPAEKLDFL